MVQCGLRCRAGTGVRTHEDCCRMRDPYLEKGDPDLEKARHDAPARESPASRSDLLIVITDQTMTGRTHFTRLLLYSSSHASTPIFREFSITYKYLGTYNSLLPCPIINTFGNHWTQIGLACNRTPVALSRQRFFAVRAVNRCEEALRSFFGEPRALHEGATGNNTCSPVLNREGDAARRTKCELKACPQATSDRRPASASFSRMPAAS